MIMIEKGGTGLGEAEVKLLADLLEKMLRYCPEDRIPISEVLQHPWFTFKEISYQHCGLDLNILVIEILETTNFLIAHRTHRRASLSSSTIYMWILHNETRCLAISKRRPKEKKKGRRSAWSTPSCRVV